MAHHATSHEPVDANSAAEGNVALAFFCGLLIAIAAIGLSSGGGHASVALAPEVSLPSVDSPREVRGTAGAIATAAPEASAAGLEVMRKGGNAFDALIASSFVVSVVRPQSTGIGGGGFVVYHDVASGRQGAFDGRERAPSLATEDMYVHEGKVVDGYRFGPLSAGVPGLVAMLYQVYEEFGSKRISWAELVQPAIDYARNGFIVPAPLAASIRKYRKVLERYPASAEVFLPGGKAPQAGDRLHQVDLGNTLQAIAEEGAAGFYRGPIAKTLSAAVTENGGQIRAVDLAAYQVKHRGVVAGRYRGMRVISMPPPSSGGVHLIQMLNMLSHHDLKAMGWHSTDHQHLLTEAMRRAFADRADFMADADYVNVPVQELIHPSYGKRLADSIDMSAATPSDQVRPGALFVPESDHTTHISIVDAEGNAVSSTQTINTGLGSCFVAGKTGVLMNNEMADFTADPDAPNPFGLSQSAKNLPQPGKRPLSSMTPTIVLDSGGKVRAVIGSPGGPKIITTVLQVLSNIVDFDMGALEAVSKKRIHHQWRYRGEDKLRVESGVGGVGRLSERGHRVEVMERGAALGNAQVVVVDEHDVRIAASDDRFTGRPGAYSKPVKAAAAGH